MLLVNGKKTELSDGFIKRIKAEIGPGRNIQPPRELISKVDTNKEGVQITVAPSACYVHFTDVVYGVLKFDGEKLDDIDYNKDNTGATHHRITYYENAEQKPNGELHKFTPEYFRLFGKMPVALLLPERYEEYFFLQFVSRRVKSSRNHKANTSQSYSMEVINPERDATIERVSGKWRRKCEFLVMEDETEGGFSTEQIENIARLLNLPMAQFRNSDQLRKAVFNAAASDEAKKSLSGDPTVFGYQYVVGLGEKKGPDYELRDMVTTALNKGVIGYDSTRKQYVHLSDGNIIGKVCDVPEIAPMKVNVLISFLKVDIEERERIEKAIGWNKEEPKKSKKKEEAA